MNETLLALIIAPATSVLTLLIQSFVQRRNSKSSDSVKATVGLKTARNGEMDIAFDGLQANLNSMSEQLKDVKTELRDAKSDAQSIKVELEMTRGDLRRLESVVGELRIERVQFLNWIAQLETLIPNPPGAPPRPAWMNQA